MLQEKLCCSQFRKLVSVSKSIQLKVMQLLSLQSDASEERKKSVQMHVLKLFYMV